ncbi:MAG TPA: SBBP repeat-containing protein, partial [Thermoanaerobaculia bacterium]|nr:SBBP repeat-containing protein [Thermoanaerobaculia bacterium]
MLSWDGRSSPEAFRETIGPIGELKVVMNCLRIRFLLLLCVAFPAFAGQKALIFVANEGQFASEVRYAAQCGRYTAGFTRSGILFQAEGFDFALRFRGANSDVDLSANTPQIARVNYLIGNDPARWHTGVATYGAITYAELWPGIDLAFRGSEGRLKYDFMLRPGADLREIRLAYEGVRSTSIDARGDLVVSTGLGNFTDHRPAGYQIIRGSRVPVETRFVSIGDHTFGIRAARFDRRLPLFIDPGFIYSTYLGGSGLEFTPQVAVNSSGEVIVTGTTTSADFPTTAGVLDRTFNGSNDIVVSKFDSTGTTLLYSTYLGGSGNDLAEDMAVDSAGNVFLIGRTTSHDFPTTLGAYNRNFNGGATDFYVAKLNANGSSLVYSTFVGGSDTDLGLGIAVSSTGEAYVTGTTLSSDFPTTAGAFDRTFHGSQDAFVVKLDAAGANLIYSTFLGGADVDVGESVAINSLGQAHVSGFTDSSDFPVTPGAFDTT